MKVKLLSLGIFLACIASAFGSDGRGQISPSDEGTIPLCEAPACYVVAKPFTFSVAPVSPVLTVQYKDISISVPSGIDTIGIGDNVGVIRYGQDKKILFGTITSGDLDQPTSDISVAERTEVIFTKTPKDPEPGGERNRTSWRITMLGKAELLEGALQVGFFTRESLTVYFLTAPKGPYAHVAYVVDKERKDRVVTLQTNMKQETFLAVLASVKKRVNK